MFARLLAKLNPVKALFATASPLNLIFKTGRWVVFFVNGIKFFTVGAKVRIVVSICPFIRIAGLPAVRACRGYKVISTW
jgi:hypothetical protein